LAKKTRGHEELRGTPCFARRGEDGDQKGGETP